MTIDTWLVLWASCLTFAWLTQLLINRSRFTDIARLWEYYAQEQAARQGDVVALRREMRSDYEACFGELNDAWAAIKLHAKRLNAADEQDATLAARVDGILPEIGMARATARRVDNVDSGLGMLAMRVADAGSRLDQLEDGSEQADSNDSGLSIRCSELDRRVDEAYRRLGLVREQHNRLVTTTRDKFVTLAEHAELQRRDLSAIEAIQVAQTAMDEQQNKDIAALDDDLTTKEAEFEAFLRDMQIHRGEDGSFRPIRPTKADMKAKFRKFHDDSAA